MRGETLLVVAHGNRLRGLVKHLKGPSRAEILELNIPTAKLWYLEFDGTGSLLKEGYL